jgi:hypothetical protein
MPLKLLNDPNRVGGSSQLDVSADGWVLGPFNAQRLSLWAQDLNGMLAELYELAALNVLPMALTPFSQAIPLAGGFRMPAQAVTGPLVFTRGANPVPNGSCRVQLTANGANVPDFSAFGAPEAGGWVNTAGTVNLCNFWWDGTAYGYSVFQGRPSQPLGLPVGAPAVASIAVPHGRNPTLTIMTGGSALNPTVAPPASAFTLSSPGGASIKPNGIAVTAGSITLALNGTINSGDAVTLSYAPPAPTSYTTRQQVGAVQDASGNLLAAISAATVTVS